MPTLDAIDPATTTGKTKELLDFVQQRTGRMPNFVTLLANSPAALQAYLSFAGAFQGAALAGEIRDLINVAVAEHEGSDYILSAVCDMARHSGRSESEIAAARQAQAPDAKTAAALQFAVKIAERRGHVPATEVAALRRTGFSDGEICDIVATVALNIYRTYFGFVAEPEIDFPVVRAARSDA